MRWGAFVVGGAVVAATVGACSSEQPPPQGEIIIAIQSDVAITDSVDRIRLEIGAFGTLSFGSDYPIGRDDLRIPATLGALQRESDPSAPIQFRLIARKDGVVKMLRDVTTSIPSSRVVTLRMPIRWLCDDTAKEEKPQVVSAKRCAEGQTCIGGDCYAREIDSKDLPDFVEGDVFGGGNGSGNGKCFDVVSCMSGGTPVQVDLATCTFPKPANLTDLNVALKVTNDGVCDPTKTDCFVVLDRMTAPGPLDGWREVGGSIEMPKEVCRRIESKRVSSVVVSNGCPSKAPTVPICGSWSSAGGDGAIVKGGLDGGVDGGQGPVTGQVVSVPGESSTTVGTGCPMHAVGGALFFCTIEIDSGGSAKPPNLKAIQLPPTPPVNVVSVATFSGEYTGPFFLADRVFWLDGSAGTPRQLRVATPAQLSGVPVGLPQLNDLYRINVSGAIDTASLFGVTISNPVRVARYALDGSLVGILNNGTQAGAGVIMVVADSDPVNGFVYFAARTFDMVTGFPNTTIERVAKSSMNVPVSTLVGTVPTFVQSIIIDGADLLVLARDSSNMVYTSAIYRMPASGGAATPVYQGLEAAESLILSGSELFWLEGTFDKLGKVMRGPKAGGAAVAIANEPLERITTLAVTDTTVFYGSSPLNPMTKQANVKSVAR